MRVGKAKRYLDPAVPVAERVEDLLSRMTLEEKVSQMTNAAAAIPRLRVPAYDWWTECLHGVARAGRATVFPQAIGMAASFDAPLLQKAASAIADEVRAKHHDAARRGSHLRYQGLTCWAPNINIFRDPRWGRGQETYGEDPYLTSRMGVAFCQGLQGDHPRYFKTIATPKHFAVHSGPEKGRHALNAKAGPRDMAETYLRAFEACVTEGGAFSVMGAYSRTNDEPCCASKALLQDTLRGTWGFPGYVVSDCGAVDSLHGVHGVTKSAVESAAHAVRRGCDLNCGDTYRELTAAVAQGLITEKEIDVSVRRLLTARFRLGMFDPPRRVPFTRMPPGIVDCAAHRGLARQMARESIVLLKNEGNLLPLRKDLKRIAVVGPNAYRLKALVGNYYGFSEMVTPLEGIVSAVSAGTVVEHRPCCDLSGNRVPEVGATRWFGDWADAVVAVMGYSAELEGEEGEVADSDGGGDRVNPGLPPCQEEFLKQLMKIGKPVVVVLTGGSPLALNWAAEHCPAILMAWYGGEEGGNAIADVLFGDYNPAGRLPVTFPKSWDGLPDIGDYNMDKRTYRFRDDEPLYRFGYGLSYTKFRYSGLKVRPAKIRAGDSVRVEATVQNVGKSAGDEVVQLYVRDVAASVRVPRHHLEGFARVHLKAGRKKKVIFRLTSGQLACYADDGRPMVEPGAFRISVGGGQPDDPAGGAVSAALTVV